MARRRLLDSIAQCKPGNPVGTSITSQNSRSDEQLRTLMGDDPHVKFIQGSRRGYVRVELTPARLRADLQAMRNVTDASAGVDTLTSFVVEDGRPGAVRA